MVNLKIFSTIWACVSWRIMFRLHVYSKVLMLFTLKAALLADVLAIFWSWKITGQLRKILDGTFGDPFICLKRRRKSGPVIFSNHSFALLTRAMKSYLFTQVIIHTVRITSLMPFSSVGSVGLPSFENFSTIWASIAWRIVLWFHMRSKLLMLFAYNLARRTFVQAIFWSCNETGQLRISLDWTFFENWILKEEKNANINIASTIRK